MNDLDILRTNLTNINSVGTGDVSVKDVREMLHTTGLDEEKDPKVNQMKKDETENQWLMDPWYDDLSIDKLGSSDRESCIGAVKKVCGSVVVSGLSVDDKGSVLDQAQQVLQKIEDYESANPYIQPNEAENTTIEVDNNRSRFHRLIKNTTDIAAVVGALLPGTKLIPDIHKALYDSTSSAIAMQAAYLLALSQWQCYLIVSNALKNKGFPLKRG